MNNLQVSHHNNTWIELSEKAIVHNVKLFKNLLKKKHTNQVQTSTSQKNNTKLMAVIKANAYGHGIIPIAKTVLQAGVNWLGVFSVTEGLLLRENNIAAPILVFGPTSPDMFDKALKKNLSLTLASVAQIKQFCSQNLSQTTQHIHLKLETGTNRQGLNKFQLPHIFKLLKKNNIMVEGVYTHFADIEDTTTHDFAQSQLQRFSEMLQIVQSNGFNIKIAHTACTAAAILFAKTYFSMIRVGIGIYGLWPSKETQVSAGILDRHQLQLKPVMTWKTKIVQIKDVLQGDYISYGRTFRTTRPTRIAVLPVGYADGYDRRLSNNAHTLVCGIRAPIVGRVCMNFTMIDVTDILNVKVNDEVVLLGTQGNEKITAEDLAQFAGTINYEIVTRAAPGAPRILV